MKAEELIENESVVVVNPDYPVIAKEYAMEAIEMIKDEAIEAFSEFIEEYCSESGRKDISSESEHYIEVFKSKLEEKR